MKRTKTICRTVFFGAAFAIACFGYKPAMADLVLSFSVDDGASFSNSFDVITGDRLSISIYALETGTNNELSDPTKGLASFGFDLTSDMPGSGNISSRMANAFYDLPNHDETTATGFEWEFFRADTTSLTGESILLGTFQYDTIADGTTTFMIEDRAPGSGLSNASWLTPGLEVLDEQFFGTGATNSYQLSVNASAVPEPTSLVMLGAFGLAAGLRRWRRNG